MSLSYGRRPQLGFVEAGPPHFLLVLAGTPEESNPGIEQQYGNPIFLLRHDVNDGVHYHR